MRESRNILITGGLGYVGGRIANYLQTSDYDCRIKVMTRKQIQKVPNWASGFEVCQGDLSDDNAISEALENVDTVLHLAALNEIDSGNQPDYAVEVNGQGTHNVLKSCVAKGIRQFIYMSTFHVYGAGSGVDITELVPTKPVHPYSITHRLAEDFVNWYRYSQGMETLILRLSNGYGYPADEKEQRWSLVFNDLCWQAVQSGEIRLRTSGVQHRDFISLHDVARAIEHFLILSPSDWDDGIFNLGGETSMSIYDVAQIISIEYKKLYGREIPIFVGEDNATPDSKPVIYNIDKLKQTGFELTDNLTTEIIGTLELCQQMLQTDL